MPNSSIKRVFYDPNSDELWLDNAGQPCVRLIEGTSLIEGEGAQMRRIGAAGVYVEKYVEGSWQYAAGPFFLSLTGWPQDAIEAAKRIAY